MSDKKMSDFFKLPMICEAGDGYIYSQDYRYSIRFDDADINCLEQKRFVANAISQHDKITEERNLLREALELILKTKNYVDIDIIASEALEQTK